MTPSAPYPGSTMTKILIVDDDASMRDSYATLLGALCADIDQAADGDEALAKLAVRRYAAIIMDLHMPTTDGLGVLDALQVGESPNRETPIIVVTGDASVRSRIEVLRRKTLFLFNKPFDSDALRALVQDAIARSSTPTDAIP